AFGNKKFKGAGKAPVPLPAVGEKVLGFVLEQELGVGGFARVYLAKEPDLGNRRVVVKVSPTGAAEAGTLGQLNHPNIVPVHAFRREDSPGLTAVCMPYLGAATLQHLLDATEADLPARATPILEIVRQHLLPDGPPGQPVRPARVLVQGSYLEGVLFL